MKNWEDLSIIQKLIIGVAIIAVAVIAPEIAMLLQFGGIEVAFAFLKSKVTKIKKIICIFTVPLLIPYPKFLCKTRKYCRFGGHKLASQRVCQTRRVCIASFILFSGAGFYRLFVFRCQLFYARITVKRCSRLARVNYYFKVPLAGAKEQDY